MANGHVHSGNESAQGPGNGKASNPIIAIVNYGLGNVAAFANIYKNLKIPYLIGSNPQDFAPATKIILPGVGSFDGAMQLLNRSGLRPELDRLVLGKQIPVLGVCVGMQIMALESDEGNELGLGWVDAKVKGFELNDAEGLSQIPHMGWNDVNPIRSDSLFSGAERDWSFYFLHSFYVVPTKDDLTLATSNYGSEFTCAVESENIFGVQFHPEKSHEAGVQLLKNFGSL